MPSPKVSHAGPGLPQRGPCQSRGLRKEGSRPRKLWRVDAKQRKPKERNSGNCLSSSMCQDTTTLHSTVKIRRKVPMNSLEGNAAKLRTWGSRILWYFLRCSNRGWVIWQHLEFPCHNGLVPKSVKQNQRHPAGRVRLLCHAQLIYYMCYICLPVVLHKAVAEVSRIGHYRKGELLWCMGGRANPLMDRKVVGVAVVTSPQLLDVVWCTAVVAVVVVVVVVV